MAFIDYEKTGDPNEPTFYNLDAAVGSGGKNTDEDVRVVQFFLQRIYQNENMRARTPKGAMTIDGKCGPVTCNWILKFQLDLRNSGQSVLADGVVDRALGGAVSSSQSRTIYVIRFLNTTMRKLEPFMYRNLTTHPEVPAELRLAFGRMQATGAPMVYGQDN